MSDVAPFRSSRGWHWIIYQFRVRLLILFVNMTFPVDANHWMVATSVDVERVFSQGRLILSHVRNRLSAESTRALMCLGVWSRLGYVHDSDVKAVAIQADLKDGEDEPELEENWAKI
jgi:hypothetical protein